MKEDNLLKKYEKNITSQFGEDGILEKIFEIIPRSERGCVEFGAWDGKFMSNCYNLIKNKGWRGILIEASKERFKDLLKTYANNRNVMLVNKFVNFEGENSLDRL